MASSTATQSIDFGFKDRFGRKIGCRLYTGEDDERGHYYLLQSTRDGSEYGASQSRRFFETESERDKAATKAVAGSSKSQRKRHCGFVSA